MRVLKILTYFAAKRHKSDSDLGSNSKDASDIKKNKKTKRNYENENK